MSYIHIFSLVIYSEYYVQQILCFLGTSVFYYYERKYTLESILIFKKKKIIQDIFPFFVKLSKSGGETGGWKK